jgi:hypothetical protein
MPDDPTLKFAAIGLDHRHIYHQVGRLLALGAECKGFYGRDEAVPLPYYERLRNDIFDRTGTAMPQAHRFKVCELPLRAQAEAKLLA